MPFAAEELTSLLEADGYELSSAMGQLRAISAPAGARLEMTGEIASKAEPPISIRLEAQRGIIVIQGRDLADVREHFVRLQSKLAESLFIDLQAEARFFEIVLAAECLVGPQRNPLSEIAKLFSGSPQFAVFSETLGQGPLTNFGVQLVRSNASPQDESWFDLTVKPSVRKPDGLYDVSFVFRDPDQKTVLEMTNQAAAMIQRVLDGLKA
jgi:hypothetical protein